MPPAMARFIVAKNQALQAANAALGEAVTLAAEIVIAPAGLTPQELQDNYVMSDPMVGWVLKGSPRDPSVSQAAQTAQAAISMGGGDGKGMGTP